MRNDKKKKKKKKKLRIIPVLLMILVVLAGIGSFNIYKANPFIIGKIEAGNNDELSGSKSKRDRINILVFGVDSADDESSDNTRSDTIMVLTIDQAKKEPTIISIPRDTRVKIPDRKNYDKINHAHAYGGPELLVETVENFLDIDITYYVRINYNAVIEVVDALGGVEIDVPMDMKYSDPYATPPLKINLKKGLQTLNGKQSVEFMRFRKGYANQDLGRIEAQQAFVKALLDTAISPSTVMKLPQLIDIAYKNVETNIPESTMLHFGYMGLAMDTSNLVKVTLEGVPKNINGISYYAVTEEAIANLKSQYFIERNSDIIEE